MPRTLGNSIYYDPKEVAIILDKHYETALGRIKDGQIKSEKINNGYLVKHDDLVDYLNEHEALPGEDVIQMRLHKTPVRKVSAKNQ